MPGRLGWATAVVWELSVGSLSFCFVLPVFLDSIQSHSVVDTAIYAIQWAHNLAGFPSPIDDPIIHNNSKAAKKTNGVCAANRKLPVTADMIQTLVKGSNLTNLLELRNLSVFLSFLLGSFQNSRGSKHFHNGYVPIDFTKSKTIQSRRSNEVCQAYNWRIEHRHLSRWNFLRVGWEAVKQKLNILTKRYRGPQAVVG